jgi:ATP-dependent Clp protease ATP-binding subunit ClpC
MYQRFTDRARKVMQLANQEARRLNHEYIGTEHILLGLVREGTGVAAKVLEILDIDLRKLRLEVEKIVQAGPDMVTMGKLPPTPRAKKVVEYAIDEARKLDQNFVGTEHLLLGLIRENEGVGAQVLLNLGLSLPLVRDEVLKLIGRSGTLPSPPAAPLVESFSEKPLRTGVDAAESRMPGESRWRPPRKVDLAIQWIRQLCDFFEQMKRDAVSGQDFERAVELRVLELKLRHVREWLARNKDQEPPDTNITELS